MQKLIQLFYKRRSTLHQWLGDQSPGRSSHHTLDRDDDTSHEIFWHRWIGHHWCIITQRVLDRAGKLVEYWLERAFFMSNFLRSNMRFLRRYILCTILLYWVSTRDSYSAPYLHVPIMIRQTLQASDRVCLYNLVARSVSVKIGKEFWYQ